MFARIVEFEVKLEKKNELLREVKNEILPILKKQPGFVEILPFSEEIKPEKVVAITLWHTKRDAERYVQETSYKLSEMVKPYLATPIVVRTFTLETTICKHFVEALTV